jgi:flagellar protein FliS
MTKEQINEYTMRICQANTSSLALILYELVISCIQEGIEVYEQNQPSESRKTGTEATDTKKADGTSWEDAYERSMVQAQNFLQELMHMSRTDSEVAADVMALYLFIDKQLLLSIVKKHPVNMNECIHYLRRLMDSFAEICKNDYDSPIMKNTQQVYAGLTYGKGYLTESLDPMDNVNRGLKA